MAKRIDTVRKLVSGPLPDTPTEPDHHENPERGQAQEVGQYTLAIMECLRLLRTVAERLEGLLVVSSTDPLPKRAGLMGEGWEDRKRQEEVQQGINAALKERERMEAVVGPKRDKVTRRVGPGLLGGVSGVKSVSVLGEDGRTEE